MINWVFYPRSTKPGVLVTRVVAAFESQAAAIDCRQFDHRSNEVLALVAEGLREIGFVVEAGKKQGEKIRVPVLFGLQGRPEKTFEADAYHEEEGFVIEVEAGRAVVNNQFLKDLFQACMMHDVRYLAIAVRNTYKSRQDFEMVRRFFDTLYASQRLRLPLDGLLLIGY